MAGSMVTPDKPTLSIKTRASPWSGARARYDTRLGQRMNGSLRWKIGLTAALILLMHVLGTNLFFPMLSDRGAMGTSSSRSNGLRETGTEEDWSSHGGSVDGGIIRLLAETTEDVFSGSADGRLTAEQFAVLSVSHGKLVHGGDVSVRRDGLSNPLSLPVKSVKELREGSVFAAPKARTLHSLHTDKCRNKTLIPYRGETGKEWSTSSRSWWKSFGEKVSKYRWCRGGSEAEVPDLKQVMILQNRKERPKNDVTIVTQLSLERLDMLEQQCSLWPGSIAAVVYVPLVHGSIFSPLESPWQDAPLDQMVEELQSFHEYSNSLPCYLDIEVVAEERCSIELAAMYPTNAVRNRALLLAQSDLMLLLDVDFIVSISLMEDLQNEEKYREILSLLEGHNVLVLPAFEAWDQGEWGKRLSREAVKEGKKYIVQKFMYNVVMGFHMSHYPQGHEATNFWHWINASEPYEVQYQTGFEPYILMHRRYVPYYDERFRGYYWNKVQHLMHISQQHEFKFVVHPSAFVLHVPHAKANSKYKTKRTGQKERNHAMFLEALEDMKTKRFVPVTGFPHLCLPSDLQLALAEAVGPGEQGRTLHEMAELVQKLPDEIEAS